MISKNKLKGKYVTFRDKNGATRTAKVIKITGNPNTFEMLSDNIDINAGTILDGSESLNSVGQRIYDIIVHLFYYC